MSTIIETPCGFISGGTCQWPDVIAYKGIRYATAKRWEYPKLVTSWDGILEAHEYGNACYQPRSFYDESKNEGKAFYYNEFRKDETYPYSEDCLFLNVFTPKNSKPGDDLPVIFYIHGGGFTGGCGNEKHFNAPVWATMNAIAVTINYRLGPLGFACLPELVAEAGHTGNYGLYDQLCAMQWVKDNIKAFGGDPNNITLMGQSAGAMSVQSHILSHKTDGLFTKAIMCSGGGVNKIFSPTKDASKWYTFWEKVMANANCSNLSEFRAISPEELQNAYDKTKTEVKGAGMACFPCIDGDLISESGVDIFKRSDYKDIPIIIGTTSEDIVPPIVYNMAKKWCISHNANKQSKAYMYHFCRQLPGDDNGAWHSSDLWYWFGTLHNSWRPMTDVDDKISSSMVDYLLCFARFGDPNNASNINWQPMEKGKPNIMVFGKEIKAVGKISNLDLIKTMLTNKAVGE